MMPLNRLTSNSDSSISSPRLISAAFKNFSFRSGFKKLAATTREIEIMNANNNIKMNNFLSLGMLYFYNKSLLAGNFLFASRRAALQKSFADF